MKRIKAERTSEVGAGSVTVSVIADTTSASAGGGGAGALLVAGGLLARRIVR